MFPLRDEQPTRKTPWLTYMLIAINVAVFLYTYFSGTLGLERWIDRFGVLPRRLVQEPSPQAFATVITSMFMHGGWLHLMGNTWFLHVFGDNVEDRLGGVIEVSRLSVAGWARSQHNLRSILVVRYPWLPLREPSLVY